MALSYTKIRNAIVDSKASSAWDKGVKNYAIELFDNFIWNDREYLDERELLDGAMDWHEYSWGGYSLIYDSDIAERLCNPTELKRTNHGRRRPNKNEEWLDVQTRALFQAARLIMDIARNQWNNDESKQAKGEETNDQAERNA